MFIFFSKIYSTNSKFNKIKKLYFEILHSTRSTILLDQYFQFYLCSPENDLMILQEICPKNVLKNSKIRVNLLQKFSDEQSKIEKNWSHRIKDLVESNISKNNFCILMNFEVKKMKSVIRYPVSRYNPSFFRRRDTLKYLTMYFILDFYQFEI